MEVEVLREGHPGQFDRGYISHERLLMNNSRSFNVAFHDHIFPSYMTYIPQRYREDELRLVNGDDRIWGPFEPLQTLTQLTELSLGNISLIGDSCSKQMSNHESLKKALPACRISFGSRFSAMMFEFDGI